jgi:hypothetical protein
MHRHIVSYVQRKRITDWKRIVFSEAEPFFVYGSNDDRVFEPYLSSGGTLWVFSSIPKHAPELVARLDVRQVVKRTEAMASLSPSIIHRFREFRWIALARRSSKFFGYNDAARALQTLKFERASGEDWSLPHTNKRWESRHGSYFFRRPQLVAAPTVDGATAPGGVPRPLAELEAQAARTVFISWKWQDTPRAVVRNFAHELAAREHMPWLDQLALPPARAHRKLREDPTILERLLKYGYGQATALVGLETPQYGTKTPGSRRNWTLREWTGAISEKPPANRIAVAIGGTGRSRLLADADHRVVAENPKQAARAVCAYLENAPG